MMYRENTVRTLYCENPQPERTVTATYIWAIAYAVLCGAHVVRVERISGRKTAFTLDDTDGVASHALQEWRFGEAVSCDPRKLVNYHANLVDMAIGSR